MVWQGRGITRNGVVALLLTLALCVPITFAQSEPARAQSISAPVCGAAATQPSTASAALAAQATLCAVNRERAARGLQRLSWQAQLASEAQAYSQQMVAQGFFSHVAPGGMDLHRRNASYMCGRVNWHLGETLAWEAGPQNTPEGVVAAWLGSPPHRKLLLDPSFHDIGVGVASGVPVSDVGVPGSTYAIELGVRGGIRGTAACRASTAR